MLADTVSQFNEVICPNVQAACLVPALVYEPALHGKRFTLSHLFRMRRTPALKQAYLDQAAGVVLLIFTLVCARRDSDSTGRNNREHAIEVRYSSR